MTPLSLFSLKIVFPSVHIIRSSIHRYDLRSPFFFCILFLPFAWLKYVLPRIYTYMTVSTDIEPLPNPSIPAKIRFLYFAVQTEHKNLVQFGFVPEMLFGPGWIRWIVAGVQFQWEFCRRPTFTYTMCLSNSS